MRKFSKKQESFIWRNHANPKYRQKRAKRTNQLYIPLKHAFYRKNTKIDILDKIVIQPREISQKHDLDPQSSIDPDKARIYAHEKPQFQKTPILAIFRSNLFDSSVFYWWSYRSRAKASCAQ